MTPPLTLVLIYFFPSYFIVPLTGSLACVFCWFLLAVVAKLKGLGSVGASGREAVAPKAPEVAVEDVGLAVSAAAARLVDAAVGRVRVLPAPPKTGLQPFEWFLTIE